MTFLNLKWMAALSLVLAVTSENAETNRVISAGLNQDLKKISEGAPATESTVAVTSAGEFVTSLPVRENDVYFLSLTRQ